MIVNLFECEGIFLGASIAETSHLLPGDLISIDKFVYRIAKRTELSDTNYSVGYSYIVNYLSNVPEEDIIVVNILKEKS